MTDNSKDMQPKQTEQDTIEVQEDIPEEEADSEAHIKKCLEDAEELKLEGNDHFRSKRWDAALASYRAGLGRLPKRRVPAPRSTGGADAKGKGRADDTQEDDELDGVPMSGGAGEAEKAVEDALPPPTELELECARARAVMNANIGACYVKLGEHKEAVAACTEALADDPKYVKALQRRASSNEQLNTWSSLSSAQEDYDALLTILPPSSPQLSETRRAIASLKPRLEAAQKRETDEMMDKLKGLGNNILGKFGLSTDNFKFVPNGQGGYSMNFVR